MGKVCSTNNNQQDFENTEKEHSTQLPKQRVPKENS